jgi:predicted PurR-regulated permease PerM
MIHFGPDTRRPYWFIGGLVVLAMLREIRVKPIVAGIISQIAAASYMAYLAHPVVLHMTKFVLPTRNDALVTVILTYFGTIAAGMAGAWIWQQVTAGVSGLFSVGDRGRVAAAT